MDILTEIGYDDIWEQTPLPNIVYGRGNPRHGYRETRNDDKYMRENDLIHEYRKMKHEYFLYHFIWKPKFVQVIYKHIEPHFVRDKEHPFFNRNKLLVWLYWAHTTTAHTVLTSMWKCTISRTMEIIEEVTLVILKTFKDTVFGGKWYSKKEMKMLTSLNKILGYDCPEVSLLVDGSHKRCVGQTQGIQSSWKDHWNPCFNVSFVSDAVMGLIVNTACNANSRNVNDINMLMGSNTPQYLYSSNEKIIADAGYIGCLKKHVVAIPSLKPRSSLQNFQKMRNKELYEMYPKDYWYALTQKRIKIEQTIGIFFWNKFKRLYSWNRKGKYRRVHYIETLFACVCLYNFDKLYPYL